MKKYAKFVVLMPFFTILCILFAFFEPLGTCAFVASKEENLTSAKAMAVIEKSSGRLLYYKNQDEKLPMASTTKIITAIYVIEHTSDLDKVFCIPKEASGIEGTSIGLKDGEHLTIRELLYGLMLRSGNDCAVALAIATSGSEEKFVADVNAFLKEKGLVNTKLKNPHGLPASDHYTTAKELALITAYALKNPIFSEIVSTKEYQVANELRSNFSRKLINKNKMLSNFEFADGVKTGYTRSAGRCFVGSATKDGMQVVCVLLNCVPMFEDCEKLLKMAFDEYKLYPLAKSGDKLCEVQVENASLDKIDVFMDCDFSYPLKRSELNKIEVKTIPCGKLSAPIKMGTNLATIEISLEKQLIFSHKIFTINGVEANDFGSKFTKIIEKM